MEALWRLEDKWKLSTHGAVILLVCAASLFMGVCAAATVFKRRSAAKRDQSADFARPKWPEAGCACSWGGSMKRVLMATVTWSGASKSRRGAPSVAAVGRQSHNSESPVWQRPILLGKKCEMPRFIPHVEQQERTPGAVRTTLRDLL
uniref:Uncharacterized protein n=1 Tax=Kalanchoe fedtschenkoi TaxID=63787 RepID=A0A7N0V0M6_KALFE